MKRFVEALVMMEMVAVIVAMAIVGLCGGARAEPVQQTAPGAHPVLPVVTLRGSASFPTGRASGATPAKFKSCGAKQIEQLHGTIGHCPKGSKIGSGTVKGQALQIGLTTSGRVNLFNSHEGKNITFNIQTLHPAAIDESIDAPLTQMHGKYRERLTLVIPHSLQEIISGVFVGVQQFDVTLNGTVVVNGVRYGYLKARACPKQRTLHGVFDFKNWTTGQTATVTADAKVHCSGG